MLGFTFIFRLGKFDIRNNHQPFQFTCLFEKKNCPTRMHSSRMRTVRSSGLDSLLGGRGCLLGGCLLGGCLPREDVCLGDDRPGVVCPGGVCPGLCLPGDVYPGGVSARGICVWQTPPVDRMTDACENITLPPLRCGR